MFKSYAVFEDKEGDHEVKVLISDSCPLGTVHNALFKALSYVVQRMNEAQKANEPKQPEEAKAE